jgi:hypothetical protein
MAGVLIRIDGFDLPGSSCGPGPDFPDGHHNIHVAVQGRRGQQDLLNLLPADVTSATWELDCAPVSKPPAVDLRGPQIHGSPGKRFVYITWGVAEPDNPFRMIWLDAVPPETMQAACDHGLLVGRLGLSDHKGRPLCAPVRPRRIQWSAGTV